MHIPFNEQIALNDLYPVVNALEKDGSAACLRLARRLRTADTTTRITPGCTVWIPDEQQYGKVTYYDLSAGEVEVELRQGGARVSKTPAQVVVQA